MEIDPDSSLQRSLNKLDCSALERNVGYNARRAWLVIAATFAETMAPYGLRPSDFSVLSLLAYNPGSTSKQLCSTLAIQPPNLVKIIATLDSRGLIERQSHPQDRRAQGLYLTCAGKEMFHEAELAVEQFDLVASARLSEFERKTLIDLLQKIYL